MLSLASLLALPDAFLLVAEADTGLALWDALEKHIIADDVVLERLEDHDELAFEGPGASPALERAGGRLPEPGRVEPGEWQGSSVVWWGGGQLTSDGSRVLGPRAVLQRIAVASGLPELPAKAALLLRIAALKPLYGVDLDARCFPQEARLDDRVSFTKGCYIGQEIVARIQSRGAVNRLLVRIRPEREVEPGAEIRLDGRAVGSVTSAAACEATGPLALGLVKRAATEPGTRLEVDGVPAVVER